MGEARPVDYSKWDGMYDSDEERQRSERRRHVARERLGTAGAARLGSPAQNQLISAEADFLDIYSKIASGDGAPKNTHAFPATLMEQRARCEEARALKEQGNAVYRQGDLVRAACLYEQGVFKFADWYGDEFASEEERALVNESKLPLHLNLAVCSFRLGNHAHAAAHASQVIQHEPHNAKALYRRGASRTALGDIDGALADLELAAELAPTDARVRRALRECRAGQRLQRERERRLGRRMAAWGAGEAASPAPHARLGGGAAAARRSVGKTALVGAVGAKPRTPPATPPSPRTPSRSPFTPRPSPAPSPAAGSPALGSSSGPAPLSPVPPSSPRLSSPTPRSAAWLTRPAAQTRLVDVTKLAAVTEPTAAPPPALHSDAGTTPRAISDPTLMAAAASTAPQPAMEATPSTPAPADSCPMQPEPRVGAEGGGASPSAESQPASIDAGADVAAAAGPQPLVGSVGHTGGEGDGTGRPACGDSRHGEGAAPSPWEAPAVAFPTAKSWMGSLSTATSWMGRLATGGLPAWLPPAAAALTVSLAVAVPLLLLRLAATCRWMAVTTAVLGRGVGGEGVGGSRLRLGLGE